MFTKLMVVVVFLMSIFSVQASNILSGSGKVLYVVDGDTYQIQTTEKNLKALINNNKVDKKHVDFKNSSFRVRLSNVNTAESVHKNKLKNTKSGKDASDTMKSLLSNKRVDFECYEKGHYGRAVCSISNMQSGDVGLYLINNGMSKYISKYGKHPTMHRKYAAAKYRAIGSNIKDKYTKYKN